MNASDGPPTLAGGVESLSRLERSLRRALATSESEETRFHIRTALQYIAVLREHTTDALDDPHLRSDHR